MKYIVMLESICSGVKHVIHLKANVQHGVTNINFDLAYKYHTFV